MLILYVINLSKHGYRSICVTIPNKELAKLEAYCKKAGASRSRVIQILLSLHLEDLILDVSNIKFLDKDGNEVKAEAET